MKNFILTALLLLCAATTATAYEYVFDWAAIGQVNTGSGSGSGPVYPATPTDGIDVYVHGTREMQNIMIYAWLDDGTELYGDFPGVDVSTVGNLKQIAKSSDLSSTTEYFKVHFDYNKVNVIFKAPDGGQTIDLKLDGAGSYFFQYDKYDQNNTKQVFDYYSDGDVIQDFITTSGDHPTIYTRIMDDSNFTPTIYMWNTWAAGPGPDWGNQANHHEMEPVVIKGQTWYKYFIDQYFGNVKIIISNHGDTSTQTGNITLTAGSNHFDYYPTGYGDKYERSTIGCLAGTNDFAEVEMINPNADDEVSFTAVGEHGTATFTIHCKHSDINKVQIINGELQFPVNSYFTATVNDGFNLQRVWLGCPEVTSDYNDTGYQFGDALHPLEANTDVTDMGYGTEANALWNGSHTEHMYNISNGSNTIVSGYVSNTGMELLRTGKITRIYSEGTSLENLVDAHWGVKQLNQAFDHDLVGVEYRDNGNQMVLICRSVDYVANHNPIKEGQKSIIDPQTGNPYEWSDPNTKQYAWIALQLPEGVDGKQYEGKQLRGIRGMFCSETTPVWHIEWYNPTMIVDEIKPEQIVAEGVETHLNTYIVANLTDQSYEHTYDNSDAWSNPANRPNENGEVSFDISGDYYLIKPRRWEICNLDHVMRTDDEVIYIPDSRAVMPSVTNVVDGHEVEVLEANVCDQNDIEGYANIQRPYETGLKSIWRYSDSIMNCIGQEWRMRYKIYYIPDALVFASDFHPNDYPLNVPDRIYDIELAKKGNIGMHIIGIPELKKYEKDILISASDYWSRYKYSEDVNVYRNDLHIAPNTLKESFGNTGNLLVYREEYRGESFVREVPIARIIQKTSTTLRASGTNRVEYELEYLNLDEDRLARQDDLLKPDYSGNSDGTIFRPIPVIADTTKTTFVIGEGATDHYVSIYDMFYSHPMKDLATNAELATDYYYRVKPEVEQPNLEEVSGYAPIYKTDVNIVNHATYSKEDVDNDKTNELVENNNVTINFTPNQSIPVTEYRVYSGSWTESDNNINKIANTLVIAPDNRFLAEPISVETSVLPARVHVPEAYTDYNDNTYGCYKQKVGNATITTSAHNLGTDGKESYLAESEADIYWDYTQDENNNTVIDSTKVTKMYHVDLENVTTLLLDQLNVPHDESRYMIRMWRQVEGDEDAVLLNDIANEISEIPKNAQGEPMFSLNGNTDNLLTHYHEMDSMVVRNNDPNEVISPVSDTFFHHQLPEGATITYYATLYVYDEDAQKYYVKKAEVTVSAENMGVITGIDEVFDRPYSEIASIEYYNASGMMSKQPFNGFNIMVVRYTDGKTATKKIMNPTK